MFFDMPPVPPQPAPLMIAQAKQAQQSTSTTERTVGVCAIAGNATGTAFASIEPAGTAEIYFDLYEHRMVTLQSKVTVLQDPKHGQLKVEGNGVYTYLPTPGYLGKDKATFLVESGGYKVKMVYFFHSIFGTADDERSCGKKGMIWRISHNSAQSVAYAVSKNAA